MKTQIKLIIILSLAAVKSAFAQCPYDNSLYLSGPAPTIIGYSIIGTQTWGGDFNRVTGMVAGYTYEISTCGTPTFDSEITIYPAGGGNYAAYDDDGCGIVGGSSKIIFTPIVSGDYDILLDMYPCLSNQVDMDMVITLLSTGGSSGVLNIPVVVHVVYKNASENISDAQIVSQIDALNRDFRKLNVDFSSVPLVFQPLGADMNISFCLASVDPNGNPTTGITRTSTSVQSFSQTNEPKFTSTGGHDNWDPEHYLNLWACDIAPPLLGYATFPTDLSTDPQLDGVVIDYAYFGTINATPPFDLGRTGTHEVGHWLNLRHIWGDANCGDDFVNDTPTQQGPNSGCPAFPHVTCSNGPDGDLFYDYMDYSDDACLLLFTNGQKLRTDATISTFRSGLASSNGCGNGTTGIAVIAKDASFNVFPNPAADKITITFNTNTNSNAVLNIYNSIGVQVKSMPLSKLNDEKVALDISELSKGIYVIELINEGSKNIKKLVVQ
ncbi:MAG: T9SS type A sorting domain-containing protein [Bacteroidia bacterium]